MPPPLRRRPMRRSRDPGEVDGDGSQADRDIDRFVETDVNGFSIDAKTQMIGSIILAVLGFLAAASPSIFPSFIPAGAISDITKSAGLMSGLLGTVFSAISAYSSNKPGPLAPADPPVVVAAKQLASVTNDNDSHPDTVLRAAGDLHVEAMAAAPDAYHNGQIITGKN